MQFKQLKDVANIEKTGMVPQPGTIYTHYSFPAFDQGRPETVDGSKIQSSKLIVPNNCILMNKLNVECKRIWPIQNPADNAIASSEFIPIVPHDIDYWYLYYWLRSDTTTAQLFKMRTGTSRSQQRINAKMLLNLSIPLPDSQTQQKIGAMLRTLDAKVEINSRINDYLEQLIDARFNNSIQDGVSSWRAASLLDIADYKNGLAMQNYRPKDDDVGLPVLKIRELEQGYCGLEAERCSSEIDESVKIHNGNLVFSWSGTLLLKFWAAGDAGLNQHLFKVTSEKYPSWFYYMWTKYHLKRFIRMAQDRATTMGHIKRSALSESEVRIPEEAQLVELTKEFQPLVDQMIVRAIEARKLTDLRDTILPKLMSGEIDASNVDITQLNYKFSGHESR